ncbi:MAG TPA: glycosyltransferase family 87 protein [Thermodesulfobacteriota bacterium]
MGRENTTKLRTWWEHHGETILLIMISLMAVVAFIWLGYQFWRLLWQSNPVWSTSPPGAVDLKHRYNDVRYWFANDIHLLPYPPASYAILWPILGWLPFTPVKWIWAVTTVAMLGWLVYLVVKESGANTTLERAFVALMPISMYATGATIGNGQLIIHILPALIAGLLLLHKKNYTLREEFLAVALLIFTLVKPNASVPFLCIALFVPCRFRPAILIVIGYLALTFFAFYFRIPPMVMPTPPQQSQEAPLTTPEEKLQEKPQENPQFNIFVQLRNLLILTTWSAGWGETYRYSDLPVLLITLGLQNWIIPVTLLILAIQAFWTYKYRHEDIWLLMGVAALVARFWTYHRWYDDLLILLPMMALFRIAKMGAYANGRDVIAGVLLAITLLLTLAPGGLYLFPKPLNSLYAICQSIVWIIALVFLLYYARYEKNLKISTA